MNRCVSVLAALFLSACAPLRAGPPLVLVTAKGAFDFSPPSPRCDQINRERSNWGAAGKVAAGISAACVAGGGMYAAFERDGLSQRDAVGLATCAAVAGGVVLFSASKAEALAHDWTRDCTAPVLDTPAGE